MSGKSSRSALFYLLQFSEDYARWWSSNTAFGAWCSGLQQVQVQLGHAEEQRAKLAEDIAAREGEAAKHSSA